MIDLATATRVADLCEQEAHVARDADVTDLASLAERLGALAAALPRERHADPAVREELVRALGALQLCDAILEDRRATVAEALRGNGRRVIAARAYAASTGVH